MCRLFYFGVTDAGRGGNVEYRMSNVEFGDGNAAGMWFDKQAFAY